MFTKELHELKGQKKLVSVYTNKSDTNKFAAGYVVGVDEKHFILALVTPSGEYDGFLLKETESVYKISVDGRYNNKLLKLLSINRTVFNALFESDSLVGQLLLFAKQNYAVVSIELVNSGYNDCIGFLESIEAGVCKIQEITEYGDLDGLATIKLSDITQISCDDTDNRPLKLLYESRVK